MKDPNILYIGCHEILEYDETRLLSELGYNIRTIGAYSDPHSPKRLRPSLPEMEHDPEHIRLAGLFGVDQKIAPELIEWADVIMFMHKPEWIWKNIYDIKENYPSKYVVYRAIGQSVANVESMLSSFKHLLRDKFKIIRYSPHEHFLQNFAGEDALIRFYKDPIDFYKWQPDTENPFLLMSCQAASTRGDFCHMQEAFDITEGLPRLLIGTDNDNLSYRLPTKEVTYEEMKDLYKKATAFLYTGTLPASYTLSFLEARMTGTPIISIGEDLWRHPHEAWCPEGLFEVPSLLQKEAVLNDWGTASEQIKHILEERGVLDTFSEYNFEASHSSEWLDNVVDAWINFFQEL